MSTINIDKSNAHNTERRQYTDNEFNFDRKYYSSFCLSYHHDDCSKISRSAENKICPCPCGHKKLLKKQNEVTEK
jgi:hypothetical protein